MIAGIKTNVNIQKFPDWAVICTSYLQWKFAIDIPTEPTIQSPALHTPVLKSKPGMPCWIHHAQVPWG